MKKTMRSILALFLSAVMLTGAFPLGVFAGEELPMIPLKGNITDEEYERMFDAAMAVEEYEYADLSYVVPRNILMWAHDEEPDRVKESEGVEYVLMSPAEAAFLIEAFFRTPKDYANDRIVAALKAGEALGEIPAYDEAKDLLLVAARDFEPLVTHMYYGFIDHHDGTGSFYYSEITGWEGENDPVLGAGGVEVVMKPGVSVPELVSFGKVDLLPEAATLDRCDSPFRPAEFSYDWGLAVSGFLEDYNEEFLKYNISCTLFDVLAEAGSDQVVRPEGASAYAVVTEGGLRGLMEECFTMPFDFFNGTFLPDVKAGEIAGLTYDETESRYRISEEGGIGKLPDYAYVGWIGYDDGTGGSFYYAEALDFDDDYNAITGDTGIRMELRVEDGNMILVAYEKDVPMPEDFDPEPGADSLDYGWGRAAADFLEGYNEELMKYSFIWRLFPGIEENAPERLQGEEGQRFAFVTEDELRAFMEEEYPLTAGFFDDTFLPDVKAGRITGITYEAADDRYRVDEPIGGIGDVPNYGYVGWIVDDDGIGASFYYAELSFNDDWDLIPGDTGIRVALRVEEGDLILVAYEKDVPMPETFDPEPGASFFDYHWGRDAADFLEDYNEELLKKNLSARLYTAIEEHAPEILQEEEDWRFAFVTEDVLREFMEGEYPLVLGFFYDTFLPDVKAGRISGITYEAADDRYRVDEPIGGIGNDPNYGYVGWIGYDDGTGGSFYYAEALDYDDDYNAITGDTGIRVELRVEEGDLILVSYEKDVPMPEAFDPEPGDDPGEDSRLTEEEFEDYYAVAAFVNGFFYDNLGENWPNRFIRFMDYEDQSRVILTENGPELRMDTEEFIRYFEKCFRTPKDFCRNEILPLLASFKDEHDQPYYDAEKDLCRIIYPDENESYDKTMYVGLEERDDGTLAFYFAKAEITGEGYYVAGTTGFEIVLLPTKEGVELISHSGMPELPERDSLTRCYTPFQPRTFNYWWGELAARFLEGWRDENGKNTLRSEVCAFAFDSQAEGDGFRMPEEDLVLNVCAASGFSETYVENEILPVLRSGEVPGFTFDGDTNTWFVTPTDEKPAEENYAFVGWIACPERDGGDFYFAHIEARDAETGEITFDEGTIRVALSAVGGFLQVDAYEKMDKRPDEFHRIPGDFFPHVEQEETFTEGDFSFVVRGDEVMVFEYLGACGDVIFPEKLEDGRDVVGAVGGAFHDLTDPWTLTIHEKVTHLGGAFVLCPGLTAIDLADGSPFEMRGGCLIDQWDVLVVATTAVTDEVPPVAHIGDNAFSGGRPQLKKPVIAPVHDIGFQAFAFAKLEEVTLPASLTEVMDAAFDGNENLAKVYYDGTREEWDNINVGWGNDPLLQAELILTPTHLVDKDTYSLDAENGVVPREVRFYGNDNGALSDGWKGRLEGFDTDGARQYGFDLFVADEQPVAPKGTVRITLPL
ncbi:MAG: hypothetical protein II776_08015, partial [Clostridia bacterium]|nr:hypothetical protein [Clostridia bacterium]